MNIGVDLSPVELSPAGIGQYTISLISKLVEKDKRNSYFIYTTTPRFLPAAENIVIKVSKSLPLQGRRWINAVARDAKTKNFDLFLSPSNHAFAWLFPRTIQFIHDLAPVKHPEFFSKKAAFSYKRSARKAIAKAHKIVTVSETVKAELTEFTPLAEGKTVVAYPGLNPWIVSNGEQSSELLNQLPPRFLLCVATLEPRKNHLNLIKAYARAEEKLQIPLVIVGKKGWYYQQIFETVEKLGLQEKVLFLGYVRNEDLAGLYKKAAGFVYLSFYEGFGIPPVEALYFDVPTLVSDIPLFHETMGEHAFYTDPADTNQIAKDLEKLATVPAPSATDFVKQRYNWDKTADSLLSEINR